MNSDTRPVQWQVITISCKPVLVIITLMSMLLLLSGGCSQWPGPVRKALQQAGDNRPQLQMVLDYYQAGGDRQKLQAAEFLIANMPGHGYSVAAVYDPNGNEVAFNALDYKNLKQAQDAWDALEKKYGQLKYKRKRFDSDLKTITASYLIENIDLAFEAWHTKPWAANISFPAFCEYVLPYRGSNEPLNHWRGLCMQRYADIPSKMKNPSDMREAYHLIQADVHKWVRFSSLYYMHPTDQGFDEMCKTHLGRCEDISNMIAYAMRANAVLVAGDYTPAWANRDNNHAWEVLLDSNGRGKAPLFNVAAKIYRKTFSIQHDSLGAIKRKTERVPRWLSGKNYIDVTDQYMDTTDVTVTLTNSAGRHQRFAYLYVFNGGEWIAIHWGWIRHNKVIFTKMGRKIAYLPAYYIDGKLKPAGPPFLLHKDGSITILDGQVPAGSPKTITVKMAVAAPAIKDDDTRKKIPTVVVKPGKKYTLYYWHNGWKKVGSKLSGDKPVAFDNVPAGYLYWLTANGPRKLERIFTVQNDKQKWW